MTATGIPCSLRGSPTANNQSFILRLGIAPCRPTPLATAERGPAHRCRLSETSERELFRVACALTADACRGNDFLRTFPRLSGQPARRELGCQGFPVRPHCLGNHLLDVSWLVSIHVSGLERQDARVRGSARLPTTNRSYCVSELRHVVQLHLPRQSVDRRIAAASARRASGTGFLITRQPVREKLPAGRRGGSIHRIGRISGKNLRR